MSNPNPTNEIADWLQDNLSEWLDGIHSHHKYKYFVLRCIIPHISFAGLNAMFEFVKEDGAVFMFLCPFGIIPHISSTGINAIYEFVKEDFDDDQLPFFNPGGTNSDN